MTTLQEREEPAKESEGGSSPEVVIGTCIRNSLSYEDFDEFAFNFEDYDLWEAIRNHLGYPGGEPTCKYWSSDPMVVAVDQSPQLRCIIPSCVCCVYLSMSAWSSGLEEVQSTPVCVWGHQRSCLMPMCLCEVLVPMCVIVLRCFPVCLSLEQLQRQLHLAVCAYQDVACAVGREKAAALRCVRTKRFPLPFVAQGDSVLLLYLLEFELRCGSDSGGGYQVLSSAP